MSFKFIVSCLNVYPYTTIGYMEMFYELKTLKKGFQIQMNTHTHNQSSNGNFLWIVGLLIFKFQVKWVSIHTKTIHIWIILWIANLGFKHYDKKCHYAFIIVTKMTKMQLNYLSKMTKLIDFVYFTSPSKVGMFEMTLMTYFFNHFEHYHLHMAFLCLHGICGCRYDD